MSSSSSEIAKVVAQLRKAHTLLQNPTKAGRDSLEFVSIAATEGATIDATNIYQSIIETFDDGKSIALYEDHPCIAPAIELGTICWVNTHGNVNVLAFGVNDTRRDGAIVDSWETAEEINWEDDVRWTLNSLLFVGGWSNSLKRSVPITERPVYGIAVAISEDGTPLDVHWIETNPDTPEASRQFAQLTLMGCLNFLACRNVEIVEPQRPRAERRRIERTGVTVSEINVRPFGKSTRSSAPGGNPEGSPLTSVRGHFAEYGPRYGKGKLFGKYEGRYWIPQHARGEGETPISHTYKLQPEGMK